VARAAEGSMRDGLSLLDQVIAFGGMKLTAADTRLMLGTLDRTQVFDIVEALVARDAKRVLASVAALDERAPDYRDVLADLAGVLQKLALLQAVPDMQLDEAEDIETYQRLAAALTPEDAQLFYQIAIVGRRDLELAPDVRGGFEMVLLRMLAFGVAEGAPAQVSTPAAVTKAPVAASRGAPPAPVKPAAASYAAPASAAPASAAANDWPAMVAQMNLQGMVKELAAHSTLIGKQGNKVQLVLDADGEHFRRPQLEEKLTQALSAYFGEPVRLELSVADRALDTLARQQKAAADDRVQQARAAIDSDPNVRAMRDMFGATVQPDSVRPTE
jgi:DNA polymerase-3 subunit gamma/tau